MSISDTNYLAKMVIIDNTNKETILMAIKQVKGRILSTQYWIRNGIGRPETSQKNIARFRDELEDLQIKLSKAND